MADWLKENAAAGGASIAVAKTANTKLIQRREDGAGDRPGDVEGSGEMMCFW